MGRQVFIHAIVYYKSRDGDVRMHHVYSAVSGQSPLETALKYCTEFVKSRIVSVDIYKQFDVPFVPYH